MAKNQTKLTPDSLPVDVAMRWSVGVSFGMVLVKVTGYLLTNSAAVLGDAAESIVHIVGVLFAAYSLRLSHKPADESHEAFLAATSAATVWQRQMTLGPTPEFCLVEATAGTPASDAGTRTPVYL